MIKVAEEIIQMSNRAHPADATMRRVLKARKRLGSDVARDIAEAVYAYYRWFRWLDSKMPLAKQIAAAQVLDQNPPSDLARAVPDWIREYLQITAEWLRSLQAKPKIWLRVRSKSIADCRPGPVAGAVEYLGTKDLFHMPEFQSGGFEVQDIASQMVALACAPKPGETWWDACAGEGGKTMHLSDLMQNKGLIWASDRAQWRLDRLKRRAARAKVFNYRCAPWNGGPKLPTKTKFDGVLIDAPCSGVGTWQRNPWARWTLTPNDIEELKEVQINLLSRAAPALKPGGRLIYSVCTLTRSETIDVVQAVESVLGSPEITWLWPQDTGGNGMFIAIWKQTAGR